MQFLKNSLFDLKWWWKNYLGFDRSCKNVKYYFESEGTDGLLCLWYEKYSNTEYK